MIGWPAGVRIWLVAGVTDLRKGMESKITFRINLVELARLIRRSP